MGRSERGDVGRWALLAVALLVILLAVMLSFVFEEWFSPANTNLAATLDAHERRITRLETEVGP